MNPPSGVGGAGVSACHVFNLAGGNACPTKTTIRCLCLLLLSAPLFAQIVEGNVTNTATGDPIAGVRVQLRQADKTVYQTASDAQGAFRIEAVADGDYTAEFEKPGFAVAIASRRRPIPVHVAAGGNPVHVNVRMDPFAKVSGRVTADGRPVAGAEVQFRVPGNLGGDIAKTDRNGEYHLDAVDSGTYVLNARAPNDAPPPSDRGGRKLAWVRTFYPLTRDERAAARIVVRPGADLPGQDVDLLATPAFRVAGRVLSEKGEPVKGASVKAEPTTEIFIGEFQIVAHTDDKGAFEFRALPDGNWRLTAESESLRVRTAQEVMGHDIDRIEMRLSPPFTVTGRFIREGSALPGEPRKVGVILAAREGGGQLSFATTDAEDHFRLENMLPGSYRWQPGSPGLPYYLASIQIGTREVLGEYVELTAGMQPVTITYRSDGGTVRGSVEDCGNATIVLAPRNPSLQYPEFIRRAKCQPGGRYEIAGIRPGDYYAFAFDTPPGVLESSSFAGEWMNQAVRVTIRPGEASDATLKVTQRGAY